MNEIIVALITGGLALIGTIISGRNTVDKVNQRIHNVCLRILGYAKVEWNLSQKILAVVGSDKDTSS